MTNNLPQSTLRTSLCLIATAFILAAPARAQVSMIVSPPRIDADSQPGETIQKTIKITNPTDKPLRLKASVYDFIVQDDQGTPLKVNANASGRFLASPWFTLDKTQFTLGPKATDQVIVIIAVPSDALPGGHYAGVFFEPDIETDGDGSVSFTSAQVGSLFGITIAGDIKYDALIKSFSTGTQVHEYGPVQFTAAIENLSDTHIKPQSSVTVKDMFGRTLDTLTLEEVNIFPLTSRSVQGEWDQIWGLGRYSATLTVAYGPGLAATRTLSFWIMPWKILAAIGVLLLVLIVVFVSVRRHLKHRHDTRDQEIDELKRRIVELENHH